MLVSVCLAGGIAARAEEAVDDETRKAREKWKEVGVEDPVEVEMMRIWEKRAKSHENLKEWDIHYSPGRNFAVVYRYHKFNPGFPDGLTTLTYFRLEKGSPVFLRHDEWPDMTYDAVNDDGVAMVMSFNRCSALWHVATPDGKKWQGMFLAADPSLIQVEPDGSFGVADPITDYRVSVKDGAAAVEIKDLHEDAVLHRAYFSDFEAHLPTGITEEMALEFAKSLEALEVKADRVWARKPKDPVAWFVRTYAKDALPILRDPKKPYEKDVEIPLPLVKQLLPSIVKRQDEPEK